MTPTQQRRLYFPAWGDAARARGWVMAGRRLVADLAAPVEFPDTHPLSVLLPAIHEHAQNLAIANHRAIRPDDLRHACHVAILGRDRSSTALNNRELDRVLDLFRLLADPENLDRIRAIEDPDHAQRLRYVAGIRARVTDAYALAIARDKFGPADFDGTFWERLEIAHLAQLHLTILNRTRPNPLPAGEGRGEGEQPHQPEPAPSAQ